MELLLRLSRSIDRLTESIGKLVLWLVLVMVAIGMWNAVGRYIGQAIGVGLSSNAFIEAQWYCFSLLFLLGASYTLKHDEHVRMDMLYNTWPPQRRALANAIGAALFLVPFSALTLWFAWKPVSNSWKIQEVSPDPGGLPRYPIKAMILVCFVLLIVQGISEIIKNVAIVTGHRTPPGSAIDPNQIAPNGERES
ncbi:MAG: TRAP transporter small permease subunit [Geitlerinemataceae cyanobacterium]